PAPIAQAVGPQGAAPQGRPVDCEARWPAPGSVGSRSRPRLPPRRSRSTWFPSFRTPRDVELLRCRNRAQHLIEADDRLLDILLGEQRIDVQVDRPAQEIERVRAHVWAIFHW